MSLWFSVGPADSHNVTHNLGPMARALGVYEIIWHPERNPRRFLWWKSPLRGRHLAPVVRNALSKLEAHPGEFRSYNPPNGWGNLEMMEEFLRDVLRDCLECPNGKLRANG